MSTVPRLPHVAPLLAFLLGACAPSPDAGDATASGTMTDTLRGTVAVVGADPLTRAVLRTGDAGIELEGPDADALRRVNGLVVRVEGRLEDSVMSVTGFRVREADGLPATDGILEIDGDSAVLVTPTGERLQYTPVPSALRAAAGKRVWIAGPAGSEPQAWGVIGS